MLKNTFCHLPGIGLKRESALWYNNIFSWEDFKNKLLSNNDSGYKIPQNLQDNIDLSLEQYMKKNPVYFARKLYGNQIWRIFKDFRDSVAYIDIETTGLYNPSITTIALYDGYNINYYVNGRNLDEFINDIFEYKILISYNGKCFDIPIIESYLNIKLDHAHIDLRFLLKSLGYSGGLKRCEKQLGISRGDLDGVDGYFAVLLWDEYNSYNNQKALETLLAYNIEDVINLEKLMIIVFNMKIQNFDNIEIEEIPEPKHIEVPFKPDRNTIQYIKSRNL